MSTDKAWSQTPDSDIRFLPEPKPLLTEIKIAAKLLWLWKRTNVYRVNQTNSEIPGPNVGRSYIQLMIGK